MLSLRGSLVGIFCPGVKSSISCHFPSIDPPMKRYLVIDMSLSVVWKCHQVDKNLVAVDRGDQRVCYRTRLAYDSAYARLKESSPLSPSGLCVHPQRQAVDLSVKICTG